MSNIQKFQFLRYERELFFTVSALVKCWQINQQWIQPVAAALLQLIVQQVAKYQNEITNNQLWKSWKKKNQWCLVVPGSDL